MSTDTLSAPLIQDAAADRLRDGERTLREYRDDPIAQDEARDYVEAALRAAAACGMSGAAADGFAVGLLLAASLTSDEYADALAAAAALHYAA